MLTAKPKAQKVTAKNLHKYLGKVIYLEDDVSLEAAAGICTGLAWTRVGGELLKVEVVACKGKGHLALTGQLGDVMKESAQAGYTYIRSRADELVTKLPIFIFTFRKAQYLKTGLRPALPWQRQ